MLRFIMTVLLMAACFYVGKMSAQEEPVQFIMENIEQAQPEVAQVSLQQIRDLLQNDTLKQGYADLYRKLAAFMANPMVTVALQSQGEQYPAIYQKFNALVQEIQGKLL